MNEQKTNKIKCDACRKEITREEVRLMPLKTCCSVKRIPLCRECHEKYAKKK